jgi:hypothetical protein
VGRASREHHHEIDQAHFRLHASLPTLLDEREEIGQARPGVRVTDEEPVRAPNLSGRIAFSTGLLSSEEFGVVTQCVSEARCPRRYPSAVASGVFGARVTISVTARVKSARNTRRLNRSHYVVSRARRGSSRGSAPDHARSGVNPKQAIDGDEIRRHPRISGGQRFDDVPSRMRPIPEMRDLLGWPQRIESRRAIRLHDAPILRRP